jgi:hypothetical protein
MTPHCYLMAIPDTLGIKLYPSIRHDTTNCQLAEPLQQILMMYSHSSRLVEQYRPLNKYCSDIGKLKVRWINLIGVSILLQYWLVDITVL